MEKDQTKKKIDEIVDKLVQCGQGLEIAKGLKDGDKRKIMGTKLLYDTIIEAKYELYKIAIPGGEA